MSAKLDSLTRIMSWLREPEDSPMDRDSSEGLLAAVDNISEELLEGVDDISDIVAEPPAPDVEVCLHRCPKQLSRVPKRTPSRDSTQSLATVQHRVNESRSPAA